MLNDYWAITAAHCVYSSTTLILFTPSQISLAANWPSYQKSVQAIRVIPFADNTCLLPSAPADNDIALLQLPLDAFAGWPGSTTRTLVDATTQQNATLYSYGQGYSQFAYLSGNAIVPGQINGYWGAPFTISGISPNQLSYTLSGVGGATIARGDSGGPTLTPPTSTNFGANRQLLGVHSRCGTTCVNGSATCADNLVSSTSNCQDAAVYPLENLINQVIQEIPPPPSVILFSLQPSGQVWRYQYDATTQALTGPRTTTSGDPRWLTYTNVISVGDNNFYAVASDGSLWWWQDDGYQIGADNWFGPTQVGVGWDIYTSIFSGSNGIVYGIDPNGVLTWWSNPGYTNGTWAWLPSQTVGWGWDTFKTVFSMGQGIIYAVQQDGTLLWYKHNGYRDGTFDWTGPYVVGSNWAQFTNIVAVGNGVIMATLPDGTLYWYKHDNYLQGVSSSLGSLYDSPHAIWEGGVVVGTVSNGIALAAILPTTLN
jgi:hypothetical protein